MKIHIAGGATTKFGELWGVSPRALVKDAIEGALKDAKMSPSDIDVVFVGNMLSGILGNQANIASLVVEELGVFVPSLRLEGACASGGLALHSAIHSLLSEQYKTALVIGVEKMTDHASEDITDGLMAAGSEEERAAGATFPGLYALMAQAYMEKYHVKRETISANSVKNHLHGSFNEKAQFQKSITIEDVLKSPKIADPLCVLDCSPVSDGASAIVITSKDLSKKKYVRIVASEVATDTLALYKRKSFVSLDAVVQAAKKAYSRANISPKDISVAEIHDCFSIAEVIATEDLGFSKRGMGAKDIAKGVFTLGSGSLITNPSGGLKACGHPVGATGIKQVVEIMQQLQGVAGKRQVKDAKIGLTHNVGGSGTVAVIHVLQI